jgi:UDP-glucose 4-epimerase
MKIAVTGAAGSVGSYLTACLVEKGHQLRLLDKSVGALKGFRGLEVIEGGVEDPDVVGAFAKGMEILIHLAWSFSDDPAQSLEVDVKGTLNLLKASADQGVKHFIQASTAVVYGKPVHLPIIEDDPCLVEDARKPVYALAKLMCEKLGLIFFKEKGLPITTFRFWWAFGPEIGGRHLREMVKTALEGGELEVPSEAGGSFLHLDDLARGFESSFLNQKSFGQIFNLSSVFLTWEEIAGIIVEEAGNGVVRTVPREEWKGSSFLADVWNLSSRKAESLLGFRPGLGESDYRNLFKQAVRGVVEKLRPV